MKTVTFTGLVLGRLLHDERKHELGEGWAERQINLMTNIELIEHISMELDLADIIIQVKG